MGVTPSESSYFIAKMNRESKMSNTSETSTESQASKASSVKSVPSTALAHGLPLTELYQTSASNWTAVSAASCPCSSSLTHGVPPPVKLPKQLTTMMHRVKDQVSQNLAPGVCVVAMFP